MWSSSTVSPLQADVHLRGFYASFLTQKILQYVLQQLKHLLGANWPYKASSHHSAVQEPDLRWVRFIHVPSNRKKKKTKTGKPRPDQASIRDQSHHTDLTLRLLCLLSPHSKSSWPHRANLTLAPWAAGYSVAGAKRLHAFKLQRP